MSHEFMGRTAIVTGGARGMGAAYTRLLAAAGAHVVIADKDAETAETLAAQLQADGMSALAVATDVGDPASCLACAESALAAFGRIDHLVNNAGLLSVAREKPLHEIDLDRYRLLMDIMMNGVLFMTRAVLPALRVQGGSIVNTSSLGAWSGQGLYSLSKLGVNGLTVGLARELAPMGVRVNAVAPGSIDTDGARTDLFGDRAAMERYVLAKGKPTADIGNPEDVARAGIFLLSDAARFINGAILNVDGGQLIRL